MNTWIFCLKNDLKIVTGAKLIIINSGDNLNADISPEGIKHIKYQCIKLYKIVFDGIWISLLERKKKMLGPDARKWFIAFDYYWIHYVVMILE